MGMTVSFVSLLSAVLSSMSAAVITLEADAHAVADAAAAAATLLNGTFRQRCPSSSDGFKASLIPFSFEKGLYRVWNGGLTVLLQYMQLLSVAAHGCSDQRQSAANAQSSS
jgi:hypothetical protein